jgi:hypothetical protein
MKILPLALLIFNTSFAMGSNKDTCKSKEAETFKAELQSFVDSIKPNSSARARYAVYVANLYNVKPFDTLCFTLGYILNDDEVKYISPDYVYYYNDEIVLIRGSNLTADIFKELQFKKIEKEDSIKIANKLFPSESGGFTYTAQGLAFCKEKEKVIRTFYRNADEIPLELSIYGNFPSGGTIELIEKGKE